MTITSTGTVHATGDITVTVTSQTEFDAVKQQLQQDTRGKISLEDLANLKFVFSVDVNVPVNSSGNMP